MNGKERLAEIIEKGKKLLGHQKTSSDPKFIAWNSSVLFFVEKIYGSASRRYKNLARRKYTVISFTRNPPRSELIRKFNDDLEKTLAELEEILENYDSDVELIKYNKEKEIFEKQDRLNVSISNENINKNYNYNENSIVIKSFIEIENEIKNNSYIGNEEKKDLIEKLIELEKIKNSNDSKTDKWVKIKTILSFLLDKGADVVIMFLPQIIDILSV